MRRSRSILESKGILVKTTISLTANRLIQYRDAAMFCGLAFKGQGVRTSYAVFHRLSSSKPADDYDLRCFSEVDIIKTEVDNISRSARWNEAACVLPSDELGRGRRKPLRRIGTTDVMRSKDDAIRQDFSFYFGKKWNIAIIVNINTPATRIHDGFFDSQ